MLGVIGELQLLNGVLLDPLGALLLVLAEQRGVQLGDDALGLLLLVVEVGRVGPPHQQVVRQRLLRRLLAELLKKLVVFQAHDEARSPRTYIMVGTY